MKRLLSTLVATVVLAFAAAPAQAAFGLKDVDLTFSAKDGSDLTQAGAHPDELTATLAVETEQRPSFSFEVPVEDTRDVEIENIPGLVGMPTATPRCESADFLSPGGPKCPTATVIGINDVTVGEPTKVEHVRVYNIVPPPGVAMKIGFEVLQVPISVELRLSESPPYNVEASVRGIAQLIPFFRSELTLWGTPADPAHDAERGGPANIAEVPFLTVPRACEGPLSTLFKADSWQSPGAFDEELSPPVSFNGCAKLGFGATIEAQPSTKAAESPTGLEFSLNIKDEGLLNPDGLAQSDLREAVVTLPEGMTANPSLAEGLEACSEAQLAKESASSSAGQGCPEASKVGAVEVKTPLLEETLNGSLYIATPHQNPFKSLLALYMVIKSKDLGIVVKQPMEIEPDPKTGQLVTIATDIPQLPFSELNLRLREGARSPLISPPSCGTHQVKALLTPYSGQSKALTTTSSFQIIAGPNGSACPQGGTPPFSPGFEAGTLNNEAGAFSPFTMRLTRRDGDQDLTKFSATLPPGMVAKLAGTGMCSDAAIAAAKSKSGKAEQASPSCPESSQIGRALGGAGVGSQLAYVPGKLYLAGPHNGAPLSVVGIVPAVAGPFDVGNVVVQQALQINPRTAIVTADGAASDPLPHILAGIPLKVRDIRVYVDKEKFTLNPTSCDPSETAAQIFGGGSNLFSSLDDSPLSREARFQAAGCASLGFKPRLGLKLKGGTKRGSHPALRGTFRPRAGDANLEKLVLRLPSSAFLDQAHIRTICTRVQYAANGGNGGGCPAGAIYGKATAYTPILEQPLTGPVYLRSSDNNLPDFVAALHGLVDVEAVARIDSKRGGIRATFEDVPDAPLTKVVVEMQGGKKGLIVNSTDLCAAKSRANAQMIGQNGKRSASRPVVGAGCGKGRKAKRR